MQTPENKFSHNYKKKRFFKQRNKQKTSTERLQRVETAILQTLGYSSIFNYPLSLYQVSNFLLSKRRVSLNVLTSSLNYLIKSSKVKEKDGKYYLYKTKTVPWEDRRKNSLTLFKSAYEIAEVLKKIPWIEFIGVTGSIAAFNAIKNDDIDLFIVTKKNRVWLTRGFVFLVLKMLGMLRTEKNPARMICPNIFVGEDALSWDKSKRNVYVAHEIILMHPIYDCNNIYMRFLDSNNWVFRYFGNFPKNDFQFTLQKKHENRLVNLIDLFSYKLQVGYMKSKRTHEIIKRNFIHFNKVDNTNNVISGLDKIHSRLGLK